MSFEARMLAQREVQVCISARFDSLTSITRQDFFIPVIKKIREIFGKDDHLDYEDLDFENFDCEKTQLQNY